MLSKTIKDKKFYSDEDDHNIHKESRSIIFLLTVKASIAFLDAGCSLRQGLEKMRYHGYTAMPVIAEDGTYVGTVSEGDFLWHMLDYETYSMKAHENFPISDILRAGWNPAVKINTTLDDLLPRMMEQNFVPVVDDREKFIGIITRKNVIKHYYQLTEENKTD